ncbi:hypothetical protein ACI2OX_04085 [Bacillus sp. N9]
MVFAPRKVELVGTIPGDGQVDLTYIVNGLKTSIIVDGFRSNMKGMKMQRWPMKKPLNV